MSIRTLVLLLFNFLLLVGSLTAGITLLVLRSNPTGAFAGAIVGAWGIVCIFLTDWTYQAKRSGAA